MTKDDLISRQPETHEKRTETHACDCISREAAIHLIAGYDGVMDKSVAKRLLMQMPSAQPIQTASNYLQSLPTSPLLVGKMPSAQPDNRLEKIADLVEGTIDHFDLDDAMDLLYQIKGVLKDGRVNKPTGGD